jgi:hypothetical protein
LKSFAIALLSSHVFPVTGPGQYLAIFEDFMTAQDDPRHPPFDLPAFEGRPTATGVQVRGMDLVCGILVYFDPGIGLVGQVEDTLGIGMHFCDDVLNREA